MNSMTASIAIVSLIFPVSVKHPEGSRSFT